MKLPLSLSQKGVGSLLILMLVLLGVGLGVYLVGKQTNLLPEAAQNKYTLELYPSSEITIPLSPHIAYPDDEASDSASIDREVVFYEDLGSNQPIEESGRSVEEYVEHYQKDTQEDIDLNYPKYPIEFSASAVYVLVKDKKGRVINKKNFTFSWVSNNESILYVSPFSSCQSRKKKDNCAQTNGAYLKPISAGKTSITVNLYDKKNLKKTVAQGTFTVSIVDSSKCPSPAPCEGTIVVGDPQSGSPNICPAYYCKPPFPSTKPSHNPKVSPIPSSSEPYPSHEPPTFCTMDAKICPDGTYVGRIPPSCEFQACPK